jgi:hypothetical protein
MTRRQILSSAGTLSLLMLLLPPWQEPSGWGGDRLLGWRPLLRPPSVSVPLLDFEIRAGRLPPEFLQDPIMVEKYSSGFVAVTADIAWEVLVTEWLALAVCAVGVWLAGSGRTKQ